MDRAEFEEALKEVGQFNASTIDTDWDKTDANRDGKIRWPEFQAKLRNLFDLVDVNKDGKITDGDLWSYELRFPDADPYDVILLRGLVDHVPHSDPWSPLAFATAWSSQHQGLIFTWIAALALNVLCHTYLIGLLVFEAEKPNLVDPTTRSTYVVPDGAEIFDDEAMRKYNRDAARRECHALGKVIKDGKC